MGNKWTTSDPMLSKLVEKQMRNWELARRQKPVVQPVPQVRPFVAISRAVGSHGAEVAELLGKRLGWPVFDRQILDGMAGEDEIRRQLYESLDEHGVSWFEDAVRAFAQQGFDKNDYMRRLSRTVLTLAMQAESIFLGRGIDLVLPRDRGLRVRIFAPRLARIKRLAALKSLPPADAEKELDRLEAERADFMRRYFKRETGDVERFDLVFSLARFAPEHVADLTEDAVRRVYPGSVKKASAG